VDLDSGSTRRASERAMLGGADRLTYNLYLDRSLTQLWGDGFDGTTHYGPLRPPSGECSSIPVYGYMPPHQAVRAGNYSDTLTVTLSF
jgi:spore coat protein U-like protein